MMLGTLRLGSASLRVTWVHLAVLDALLQGTLSAHEKALEAAGIALTVVPELLEHLEDPTITRHLVPLMGGCYEVQKMPGP